MGRYLRLYAYFLRFSFSKAMAFRLDFFFRVVMDLVYYAVNLAFFSVLYRRTALIGGWDADQVRVFVTGYFCVDALHMTFFANNAWVFPILVNRGDLDYHLMRPVSSLFFVSLREFAANSFLNLLAAAGLLAWALGCYGGPLGPVRLAAYLGLLVNGAFLFCVLQMVFLIPVFWLHSNQGLNEAFHVFTSCISRPDGIFGGWVRRLLLTALPFGMMASFPARVLFDGLTPRALLHATAVSAGAFLFMRWLWGRGLRAYGSASS